MSIALSTKMRLIDNASFIFLLFVTHFVIYFGEQYSIIFVQCTWICTHWKSREILTKQNVQ